MTDWFSREGARKGHDLAREQAGQADDEDKDMDSIVVADGGIRCEDCNAVFDRDAAATTSLPSATLFRCPECERWTEAE